MTNLVGNSSPIVPLMFLPLVIIIIIFSIIVNYLIFSQIMVYLSNGFQNIPNE